MRRETLKHFAAHLNTKFYRNRPSVREDMTKPLLYSVFPFTLYYYYYSSSSSSSSKIMATMAKTRLLLAL